MGSFKSRLSLRDAMRELTLDLSARPNRTIMTAMGTLVGVSTLVSTLGIAASMNSQIQSRFDALTLTEVTVTSSYKGDEEALPDDSPNRARSISGVRDAAIITELPALTVSGTPGYDPGAGDVQVPVLAVSPRIASVAHAYVSGASFDSIHEAESYPAAVVGRAAAEQLRVGDLRAQPVIFVSGKPVVVIGVVDSVERRPILLQSVLLTRSFASTISRLPGGQLVVDTDVGAAATVGSQLALALRPDDPGALTVRIPESPETTRRLISSDTQGLIVVLAVCSLLIGGIGIANSTLVSVMERIPEIGLRRALGASRKHIVMHFLLSSAATGLAGAAAGIAIGVTVTASTALVLGWPPTLEPWIAGAGMPLGGAIGLGAGVYPAFRASRVEPIAALRTGTT